MRCENLRASIKVGVGDLLKPWGDNQASTKLNFQILIHKMLSFSVPFLSLQLRWAHLYYYTAAANNLPRFSVFVDFAQANPFSKLLVVINLHQWDAVLSTESLNQLGVHRFIAIISQDTQMSLTSNKK